VGTHGGPVWSLEFDTHMIAGGRACSTPTRPRTRPSSTSQTRTLPRPCPLPQANLIHLGIDAGISPWVYGLVAVTTRTGGYMAKRRSVRWTSWRPAAPDEQVPVGWIVGMPRLHAIEPTQHRGGPQAKEPDQGRQQPQPLGAGQLPSPGRRQPNRGRGPAGGHPDLVVGKGQPAQAELHEAGRTRRRRCPSGNTQAMTGSSWRLTPAPGPAEGHRPGLPCEPAPQSP
jgi:hypothetical protein